MYHRMQGILSALLVCVGCICMTACQNSGEGKDAVSSTVAETTTAAASETTETTTAATVQTTAVTTAESTAATTAESTTALTETSVTEETTPAQTAAESTETTVVTAEAADWSDYFGYWYSSDKGFENEMRIHESEATDITFSLFYYRLANIEFVTAYPSANGNTAQFSNADIEGYLQMEEDRIVVCITKSNVPYVEPETVVYDAWYDTSQL